MSYVLAQEMHISFGVRLHGLAVCTPTTLVKQSVPKSDGWQEG